MADKRIAVMDGNEAAAYAAYAFTEVAAIYPITPSSPMAEKTDEWSANGRKNLFGQTVTLVEMQSEAGAIGAVHGSSEAGALSTSFTSSQGLMLMLPVMHRIAGTRQPAVLHVAARTVGTHAMSIFGDQSDVMNCRGTGWTIISSGSVQEVMDTAGVAHLAAIRGRIPCLHFFDGFRTSHEIQKIETIDYEDFRSLLDMEAVERFRAEALNPEHPTLRNTVQNPDVYFQFREANNRFYDAMPDIVEHYLAQISRVTGRGGENGEPYKLFNYYGAPDAERVIVAMGSVSGCIREVVAYLNARGEKVGFLQVRLYRPFAAARFREALPASCRRIAVLDRCKEMGSAGEPLYQDVLTAFANLNDAPLVVGGRYGLSSKDTDPAQIKAVFDNLLAERPKNSFTIGITDDLTFLSLPSGGHLETGDPRTTSCKFWGLGSDGTVGANKNSVKIIGDYTDMYAQAYFEYDTKKSFGITKSHLRFGHSPILSTYLVKQADFVACHNQNYLYKYDIVSELKPGGSFLLNCEWDEAQLEQHLPAAVKRGIAEKGAAFYIIDANRVARELGLGNHSSMVLQAAFFAISGVLPVADATRYMKDAVEKTFRKKGPEVVAMNVAAVDAGLREFRRVEVPESWLRAEEPPKEAAEDKRPAFIRNILEPLNDLHGDDLPVSAFRGYEDGTMPLGTTAYEKRGIATQLPTWDPTVCLQCNRCSYVCPHGVLRPYLLSADEAAAAPAGFQLTPAKGPAAQGLSFALQISRLDCTGCGSCVASCPAAAKGALKMEPVHDMDRDLTCWEYGLNLSDKGDVFDPRTVKGSQFRQPLCEFSGACAGCGETPYAKLLTQLFGDRIYWANGTGCSQAWGSPMPSFPYCANRQGRGPAWSNSLFENNAEFALGMVLAVKQQRGRVKTQLTRLAALDIPAGLKSAIDAWFASYDDIDRSLPASDALTAVLRSVELSGEAEELRQQVLLHRDQLSKKTVWMYGGDGWAYDIGYGGLDHVIATGEDINVFVIDTEVYSNTGGQSSKATPLGATAQFQAAGKKSPKKDLGRLMMGYDNCYVANVAMGADPNQLIKAITEAEAWPGPSLIVAYTPCISHGIKLGMDNVQEEMKRAVASGYWPLYRYNPAKPDHKFTMDSPEPTLDFQTFLRGETRYSALDITFPDNARRLFAEAERQAKARYFAYKKLEDE
ncbi:MAG: pyruvate:ferredoxin (flavodoxin) oxidoreductase [Firmicutes bacterium]|nr:pyruvate:ferredoxin (flavodoxin) oxidoreductase [Bacillota bacterium]